MISNQEIEEIMLNFREVYNTKNYKEVLKIFDEQILPNHILTGSALHDCIKIEINMCFMQLRNNSSLVDQYFAQFKTTLNSPVYETDIYSQEKPTAVLKGVYDHAKEVIEEELNFIDYYNEREYKKALTTFEKIITSQKVKVDYLKNYIIEQISMIFLNLFKEQRNDDLAKKYFNDLKSALQENNHYESLGDFLDQVYDYAKYTGIGSRVFFNKNYHEALMNYLTLYTKYSDKFNQTALFTINQTITNIFKVVLESQKFDIFQCLLPNIQSNSPQLFDYIQKQMDQTFRSLSKDYHDNLAKNNSNECVKLLCQLEIIYQYFSLSKGAEGKFFYKYYDSLVRHNIEQNNQNALQYNLAELKKYALDLKQKENIEYLFLIYQKSPGYLKELDSQNKETVYEIDQQFADRIYNKEQNVDPLFSILNKKSLFQEEKNISDLLIEYYLQTNNMEELKKLIENKDNLFDISNKDSIQYKVALFLYRKASNKAQDGDFNEICITYTQQDASKGLINKLLNQAYKIGLYWFEKATNDLEKQAALWFIEQYGIKQKFVFSEEYKQEIKKQYDNYSAVKQYEKAIELIQLYSTFGQKEYQESLLILGNYYHHNINQAIEYYIEYIKSANSSFDQVLPNIKDNQEILFLLGNVSIKYGKYQIAIKCYEQLSSDEGESILEKLQNTIFNIANNDHTDQSAQNIKTLIDSYQKILSSSKDLLQTKYATIFPYLLFLQQFELFLDIDPDDQESCNNATQELLNQLKTSIYKLVQSDKNEFSNNAINCCLIIYKFLAQNNDQMQEEIHKYIQEVGGDKVTFKDHKIFDVFNNCYILHSYFKPHITEEKVLQFCDNNIYEVLSIPSDAFDNSTSNEFNLIWALCNEIKILHSEGKFDLISKLYHLVLNIFEQTGIDNHQDFKQLQSIQSYVRFNYDFDKKLIDIVIDSVHNGAEEKMKLEIPKIFNTDPNNYGQENHDLVIKFMEATASIIDYRQVYQTHPE